jgi:hypothetical protein
VRRRIEAFAATEQDVTIPSPGRKQRVVVGQVGLRCVHCAGSVVRVKRAVCYPPSVDGIYHSVSNMKFDHFKHCPALPLADQIEFEALQETVRSKVSAGKGSSNSTAKYYKQAALEIGLVDSSENIRFAERIVLDEQDDRTSSLGSRSDNSMNGISALVIAATNTALLYEQPLRSSSR